MGEAVWTESTFKGSRSIIGENDNIRIEVVPDRGSKLVSFKNKNTGREWVYQNDSEWAPLKYGMLWDNGDREGWDEMFPTVVKCPYPEPPWDHVVLPDHGEVWSLSWQDKQTTDGYRMSVQGVQIPYILHKEYQLNNRKLLIKYTLDNQVPFPIYYMWAAHYLLNIEEGMEFDLEPVRNEAVLYYSHQNRLGSYNDRVSYPSVKTEKGEVDLSRVEEKEDKYAEKYWLKDGLQKGLINIITADGKEKMTYEYSVDQIPYLGAWANYGGFWGDYNFAFEPATGYLDNLYLAHNLKKVKKVDAYSSTSWTLAIKVEN